MNAYKYLTKYIYININWLLIMNAIYRKTQIFDD